MGPGFVFPNNPDLADVWGRMDFDFENSHFWDFWKPPTCGYGAAGAFSSEKGAPYFWKPLTCGYVAAGAFFSRKMGPIFLEAPDSGRAHKKKSCGASRVHQG